MAPVPFVGPFPPPTHGQAVATATIARLMEHRGINVRRIDTGEANTTGKLHGGVRRLAGMLTAALHCLLPGPPTVYISVSANAGMIVTAALAGLAHCSGKRVILHHHTYAHVAVRTRNMSLLTWLAGSNAVHVTICPAMSRQLLSSYPHILTTATFSNVDSVDRFLLGLSRDRTLPATLGFMSNFTAEKGVERAIAAFRLAQARGLADSLILAGPCKDQRSRDLIEAAQAEFGRSFSYLGSVSGAQKMAFFEAIDVFMFPSLYRNETQGIVNLEALAAGVPVIAYGLCCIPNDLDDPSCTVVPTNQAFDVSVETFLSSLRLRFPGASAGARARFGVLAAAHESKRQGAPTFRAQQC